MSKKDGARSFDCDLPGADGPAKAQTIVVNECSAGAEGEAVTDAVTDTTPSPAPPMRPSAIPQRSASWGER